MNELVAFPTESLPALIDRASAALASARTSAEVLEARDLSRVAYDAAKSAARIMKAKRAHDSLIADVHRAQANALAIRARAEMRLAEEYDDAQERDEAPRRGGDRKSDQRIQDHSLISAEDVGGKNALQEARQFRDAEAAEPGLIGRSIDAIIERGEEPTRAALRKEILCKSKPQMAREPLWVWGRVKDFDRDGILRISPPVLVAGMTKEMRDEMRAQLPAVISYLTKLEQIV